MTTVLVFDSGVGGLTVLREVERQMPGVDLVYLADDKHFPYGVWEAGPLREHILSVLGPAIDIHRPDCVVIACNTASTVILPVLRQRYALPFVGTVPAIKPAAEATESGLISVLATPGTVKRDYTRALIEEFASDVSVTLVGASKLAGLAEAMLDGKALDDDELKGEIAACFVETADGRTDHVVLACTHFPLLLPDLLRVAPWPVTWIDSAPAIARRVRDVMDGFKGGETGHRTYLTTSGRPWRHAGDRFSV